jgi:hypothetical protein
VINSKDKRMTRYGTYMTECRAAGDVLIAKPEQGKKET